MVRLVPLAALTLAACVIGKPEDTGPDLTTDVVSACTDYLTSVNDCLTVYGEAHDVDMSGSLESASWCEEEFAGQQDAAAVTYLNCLAAAYEAVDCADPDSFGGIDITSCVPPESWEEEEDTDTEDTEFDR